MSLKQEFVLFAGQEGANALCRQFGIDRKTGRKGLWRYQAEGEAGLLERSWRPQSAASTIHRKTNSGLKLRPQERCYG
ncbi:MAG: hypothetical protein LBR88_08805 [Zoogloeaceae bacterium]|jgi:hypothetical protein|nr:hypothetical protein [Zoogloeaceae bacterium]